MTLPRPKPKLILASTITPRDMKWLWYPYIPAGSASLLFGPGGTGKSHISVDIAAALTTGKPLPGQSGDRPPQKVLMLSAEDDFDVVLVPRLMRAGADLSRVAFPDFPFTLDKLGLQQMEDFMKEFSATVVFIDPIVHYMGAKVDMNKSNEVREVVGGIHQTAMRTNTAMIIVGHSRKGRDGEDYEKAMGSVDFNNAVRSVMYTDKLSDGTRVMKHVKANYSPLGPSLGYEFGDSGFQWLGEVVDEVLPAEQGSSRSAPKRHATQWLQAFLAEGPQPAKSVDEEARRQGIQPRTLARAKSGVAESFMVYAEGKPVWYWRLATPEDQPHGAEIPTVEDGIDTPMGGREPADHRMDPRTRGGTREIVGTVEVRGPDGGKSAGGEPDPAEIARNFLAGLQNSKDLSDDEGKRTE